MELRTYLRVLSRYRWIVLPVFLITLLTTAVLTLRQPAVYSSTATFVVAPSAAFQDAQSFAAGLETLSRRAEIASTYGEVASSRTVADAAFDTLGLPRELERQLSIKGALLAGTNIFKITVEGPDPVTARDVANAVGAETIKYAQTLYEPYVLKSLDAATVHLKAGTAHKLMIIVLGAIFGLLLAAGMAFLADYLMTAPDTLISVSILDPKTRAFSKDYFMQRLGVEMTRAQRQHYPLSLALLDVDHMGMIRGARSAQTQSAILRQTAVYLKQSLRDEDLVAYFGDARFALMLPDVGEEAAKATVEKLQTRLARASFELDRSGVEVNLTSAAGVATLDHGGMDRDELITRADQAVRRAGTVHFNEEHLASEDPVASREQPVNS
jgi:diguanylate cyclase (GGDEF)-like protein